MALDWALRAGITKLSDLNIDADLAMGAHDITLAASQTVDGNDVSALAIVATGSYTGNDTANRAIAHGLGKIPKFVVFQAHSNVERIAHCFEGNSIYSGHDYNELLAVTMWDATNFYVGNAASYAPSMNKIGETVYWVAMG